MFEIVSVDWCGSEQNKLSMEYSNSYLHIKTKYSEPNNCGYSAFINFILF